MSNPENIFQFSAKKIPSDPGCYLFKDAEGTVLYVGKAKNLRKRVRSYFQKTEKSNKTKALVSKIANIETRIVSSEMEAFILENNLIKEHLPKYNILLRDDKNFLYLRITKETFPRLEITRRIMKDGSTYIGPRTSAKKFRDTIAFCQKVFCIRTCKLEFDGEKITKNPESRKLPCLDFHIHKCSGPCSGETSPQEYQADVQRMKKFLKGDTREVLDDLRTKMMQYAADKNFEAAAKTRDLIESISKSTEKQLVEGMDTTARNVVHFYREKKTVFCVLLVFRQGKLIDQATMEFHAETWESNADILEALLIEWHERTSDHPEEILIPEEIENPEILASFLDTQIVIPQKGDKRRLIEIAERNARQLAASSTIEDHAQSEIFAKALPELAEVLHLPAPPRRIECYDISHFGGTNTVASQIVFLDGAPRKNEYRRFKIQSLQAGEVDDFKALKEVLERRMRGGDEENKILDCRDKNVTILKQLNEITKLFKDIDWGLFGALSTALLLQTFWREHKDFDVLVAKKHWKKAQKILTEKGFEAEEHDENFITFTKKGFPPIDISPFGAELPIGKFTKKNCESVLLDGKTTINVLNAKAAVELERTLLTLRKDPRDEQDLEITEHLIREQDTPSMPDLIIIDGGKGQLSSVLKVLPKHFHDKVIALAKREEEVFLPGQSVPVELDPASSAGKLLQRCRDEAHRFAISFNRSLREKAVTKSALDEVPGIGGITKKKLLKAFGSVHAIRQASDDELLTVVSGKLLKALRKHL